MPKEKKIKCYELDFGDTNLIDKDPEAIIEWIKTEMTNLVDEAEELQYTITIKYLTEEEYKELPEWQ